MSKRTQKTGATARYGSRYGVSVRQPAGKALSRLHRKYTCPTCQYQKVTRQAAGIWSCKKCGYTFAGGVWEPYTRASEANHRVLRRSTDGATATDMAIIAQSRAMEYEKSLTDSDDEVSASDDSEE